MSWQFLKMLCCSCCPMPHGRKRSDGRERTNQTCKLAILIDKYFIRAGGETDRQAERRRDRQTGRLGGRGLVSQSVSQSAGSLPGGCGAQTFSYSSHSSHSYSCLSHSLSLHLSASLCFVLFSSAIFQTRTLRAKD